MSKKMTRFSIIMAICLTLLILTGFVSAPMQDASAVLVDTETRVFIDDAGREVVIPKDIKTIGSSGPGTPGDPLDSRPGQNGQRRLSAGGYRETIHVARNASAP